MTTIIIKTSIIGHNNVKVRPWGNCLLCPESAWRLGGNHMKKFGLMVGTWSFGFEQMYFVRHCSQISLVVWFRQRKKIFLIKHSKLWDECSCWVVISICINDCSSGSWARHLNVSSVSSMVMISLQLLQRWVKRMQSCGGSVACIFISSPVFSSTLFSVFLSPSSWIHMKQLR